MVDTVLENTNEGRGEKSGSSALVRRVYQQRDIEGLDAVGGHYMRHLMAMTDEGLNSKSAIAAELAFRDAEIQRLKLALEKANEGFERFERGWYLRGDALESIRAHCVEQPSVLAAAIVATCDFGLKA